MDSLPNHHLLQRPSGTSQIIKKLYSLDQEERLAEAIDILETWIQKQDHIIKKDFSRDFLEITLITCKGSVEKSKKQIDSLCTMKTLLPKFFTKTNVKMELKGISDIACIVPLPTLTKDYYRTVIVHFNKTPRSSGDLMEIYQYSMILADYIKANDFFNGFIVILNYSKINMFDLISKLNTVELQQLVSILIEGCGARLKSAHLVTESKAIELLVTIVKQIVSQKIANRIHVHPKTEDLQTVVSTEILPVEYGGRERSIHKLSNEWIEELSSEKHVEYMKIMNKACTDESRRIANKFNEEYLGMPGSFRNLSVD